MFNHWATGLRSGLLPQDCEVGAPESAPKKNIFLCSFHEGFDLLSQGIMFLRVSAGSRRSPACLLQGSPPQWSGGR